MDFKEGVPETDRSSREPSFLLLRAAQPSDTAAFVLAQKSGGSIEARNCGGSIKNGGKK